MVTGPDVAVFFPGSWAKEGPHANKKKATTNKKTQFDGIRRQGRPLSLSSHRFM
jgi:hypothetical protein